MSTAPKENRDFKLTENAHRNHEEVFPNAKGVLRASDPDLIEMFTNFAFDDVISATDLDKKTRAMMILAATIGAQAISEYKIMVGAALNLGVTPVEIKEILYGAVPYVGFAKAFDFLNGTNEVFTNRNIKLPVETQSTTTRETRAEKGLATQKAIFGAGIDKAYADSPKDLLHIQKFLSANCFGDFYTRNGLDLKQRELVTLSVLVAMGGTEPQVKAHIRGNLNVGNDRSILVSVLTQLLPWIGYPRTLNAINCLNEIAPCESKI